MPTKAEVLSKLLKMVKAEQPILIVGLEDKDIRSIHNFCSKEIRESVRHCGFGFFEGNTPAGKFSFDAGGARQRATYCGGSVAWTPLRASPEVLQDLNYNFEEVATALQREIEKAT